MVAMMPVLKDIIENPFTKTVPYLDAFGLVKVDIVSVLITKRCTSFLNHCFISFLLKEADALLWDAIEATRWSKH